MIIQKLNNILFLLYVRFDKINRVRQMLVDSKVNIPDVEYEALSVVAKTNKLDMLKCLHAYGFDIHSINEYVLRVASKNEFYEMVEYILSDPNLNVATFPNKVLRTLCMNSNYELVERVLDLGVSFRTHNDIVVMDAIERQDIKMCKIFKAQGYDFTQYNLLYDFIDNDETQRAYMLIKLGADVKRDKSKALKRAALRNNETLVKMLIPLSDINHCSDAFITCLEPKMARLIVRNKNQSSSDDGDLIKWFMALDDIETVRHLCSLQRVSIDKTVVSNIIEKVKKDERYKKILMSYIDGHIDTSFIAYMPNPDAYTYLLDHTHDVNISELVRTFCRNGNHGRLVGLINEKMNSITKDDIDIIMKTALKSDDYHLCHYALKYFNAHEMSAEKYLMNAIFENSSSKIIEKIAKQNNCTVNPVYLKFAVITGNMVALTTLLKFDCNAESVKDKLFKYAVETSQLAMSSFLSAKFDISVDKNYSTKFLTVQNRENGDVDLTDEEIAIRCAVENNVVGLMTLSTHIAEPNILGIDFNDNEVFRVAAYCDSRAVMNLFKDPIEMFTEKEV